MVMVKIQDCRRVSLEEAIEILYHNPDCFVERYDIKTGATTRVQGLFRKNVYGGEYMDQVCISEDFEYSDASNLLDLLYKEPLYTQTDEFLSVVVKDEEQKAEGTTNDQN